MEDIPNNEQSVLYSETVKRKDRKPAVIVKMKNHQKCNDTT